ncbi:hypothetical protein IFO70_17060 [Phormidium tenue FACHB-886]|nr:hypothetical protein [Phormidium tenue FACHB-886]
MWVSGDRASVSGTLMKATSQIFLELGDLMYLSIDNALFLAAFGIVICPVLCGVMAYRISNAARNA